MLIDFVPPWALFFISSALVIAAVEVGYKLGRKVYKNAANERESPVSAIAGTILGLQAFMLAFTFGLVSERYEQKKGLVREEANAIRAVWQMSDFLPEVDRAETKNLLKEYIERRLTVVRSHDPEFARSQIIIGQQLQHQMWVLAVKHGSTDLNSDIGAVYIESVKDLAGIQAVRYSLGIDARIPTVIWIVLIALLILGMLAVGYHTAIAESRRWSSNTSNIVATTIVAATVRSSRRADARHFVVARTAATAKAANV